MAISGRLKSQGVSGLEERELGGGGAEEKVRGPGRVYRAGSWSELQPAGEERLYWERPHGRGSPGALKSLPPNTFPDDTPRHPKAALGLGRELEGPAHWTFIVVQYSALGIDLLGTVTHDPGNTTC